MSDRCPCPCCGHRVLDAMPGSYEIYRLLLGGRRGPVPLADHGEAQQKRWEAAMQEAHAAYAHAYRVKHLGEQADTWHQTGRLTEYVAAVGVHATSLPPGQERTEVEAWLAFADAHLQNLTESISAPKLPTPPKPSGDDLKPFLGHWSPYGPRSY